MGCLLHFVKMFRWVPLYDSGWKCMKVYGGVWSCMKVFESLWKCMKVHVEVYAGVPGQRFSAKRLGAIPAINVYSPWPIRHDASHVEQTIASGRDGSGIILPWAFTVSIHYSIYICRNKVWQTKSNMAATGSSRKSKTQREICVKEELKIAVKIALDRFRFEESQKGNTDICLII